MTMLKYVKREACPSYKPSILSQQDIEAAQKSVVDPVNTATNKSQRRGQYNSYSKEQHAKIGAENGATRAKPAVVTKHR